jgi:hypothetical protein
MLRMWSWICPGLLFLEEGAGSPDVVCISIDARTTWTVMVVQPTFPVGALFPISRTVAGIQAPKHLRFSSQERWEGVGVGGGYERCWGDNPSRQARRRCCSAAPTR